MVYGAGVTQVRVFVGNAFWLDIRKGCFIKCFGKGCVGQCSMTPVLSFRTYQTYKKDYKNRVLDPILVWLS